MTLSKENLEAELFRMTTAELWKTFRSVLFEIGDGSYEKELEMVKNGINLGVNIKWITNKWFKPFPKNNQVRVTGHGTMKLTVFMDEIEEREDLMRDIILRNLKDEKIREPRT